MRTFKQIAEIHPFMAAQKRKDWHQHKYGRGWVQNTAKVSRSAYVGPNALVYENAIIRQQARIGGMAHISSNAVVEGKATVGGDAWVYDCAIVKDRAFVGGKAHIYGDARICNDGEVVDDAQVRGNATVYGCSSIYGDARICGCARIVDRAKVNGGTWTTESLNFVGPRHHIAHLAPGMIKIGCKELPISEWMKRYITVGQQNDYSPEEIVEYKNYIDLIALRDRQLFGG